MRERASERNGERERVTQKKISAWNKCVQYIQTNLHASVLSTGISFFFFLLEWVLPQFFRCLACVHSREHALLVMVFMQQMLQNDEWTGILSYMHTRTTLLWKYCMYKISIKRCFTHCFQYVFCGSGGERANIHDPYRNFQIALGLNVKRIYLDINMQKNVKIYIFLTVLKCLSRLTDALSLSGSTELIITTWRWQTAVKTM